MSIESITTTFTNTQNPDYLDSFPPAVSIPLSQLLQQKQQTPGSNSQPQTLQRAQTAYFYVDTLPPRDLEVEEFVRPSEQEDKFLGKRESGGVQDKNPPKKSPGKGKSKSPAKKSPRLKASLTESQAQVVSSKLGSAEETDVWSCGRSNETSL